MEANYEIMFKEVTKELLKVHFNYSEMDFLVNDGTDISSLLQTIKQSKELNGRNLIWVDLELSDTGDFFEQNHINPTLSLLFNGFLERYYVITNTIFTSTAVRELYLLHDQTGVDISLIDGTLILKLLEGSHSRISSLERKLSITKNTLTYFFEELKSRSNLLREQVNRKFKFTIYRGSTMDVDENFPISTAIEQKIESRLVQIDVEKAIGDENELRFKNIQAAPEVNDDTIQTKSEYNIVGSRRKKLVKESIRQLSKGESVFIFGPGGQGKSFIASHIARHFVNNGWYLIQLDLYNLGKDEFAKIIFKIIVGDVFLTQENKDSSSLIADVFKLSSIESALIQKLINNETTQKSISSELIVKALNNSLLALKKKPVLIFDNIQDASLELKNVLSSLYHSISKKIPVLNIVKSEDVYSEELKHLSFGYHWFEIPQLESIDLYKFVSDLVPGLSEAVINRILEISLPYPFHIKETIDFLKYEGVFLSRDEEFWVLNKTDFLLTPEEYLSEGSKSLINMRLRQELNNSNNLRLAVLLVFFDNKVPQLFFSSFMHEGDYSSNIFKSSIDTATKEKQISFIHDLFFVVMKSFKESHRLEIKSIAEEISEIITNDKLNNSLPDDVLGRVYEAQGEYREAYDCYIRHTGKIKFLSPIKAILLLENALKIRFFLFSVSHEHPIFNDLFLLLELYNKHSMLNSENRKADEVFTILEKENDFGRLTKFEQANYYYYLGKKHTYIEDFGKAKHFYDKAYAILIDNNLNNNTLLRQIIIQIGINLKHLGKRHESISYFEIHSEKDPKIEVEKLSNLAAYYLVIDPFKSLNFYNEIEKINNGKGIHLLNDMGMASFYCGDFDSAINFAEEARDLALKSANSAQQSRANNTIGLTYKANNKNTLAIRYLSQSVAQGELANNHRWLWRCRANLAQCYFLEKHFSGAYNLSYSVYQHMANTYLAINNELSIPDFHSRRYAALKAALYVFFRLGYIEDIYHVQKTIKHKKIEDFIAELLLFKDVSFDYDDPSLRNGFYYILG